MVGLAKLMGLTQGLDEVRVALLDGPVDVGHPDLELAHWQTLGPGGEKACPGGSGFAGLHGTFVAGVLAGRRGGPSPAICPGCTFLHGRLFSSGGSGLAATTPRVLAAALDEAVEAGAHVANVSAELVGGTVADARDLVGVIDRAAAAGVIVVVAAGNASRLAGSPLTQHPWVIPVVGYDLDGRPSADSNVGLSIGRRGVGAPGVGVTSLAPGGSVATLGGTSFAVPFVAGAAALLRSIFRDASASAIRSAIGSSATPRRRIVPAVMNAEHAYALLANERFIAVRS
jgi:subtilisin family serine protease